jgi:cytochrome d ubiquinol oxidase subunit I
MVAFGTLLSAFWILSANSWMQTPAGYAINEAGQFIAVDWMAAIFNPSFPYRLVHMVLAAYLTTAFVVGAVGAYHLLLKPDRESARTMFSMAVWMAALVAPVQIFAGDFHGLNTLEYQPAKIAAMEGHFETMRGAPLILFGWPDMRAEATRYAIEIPRLGSFVLTHDWNGEVKGLKAWPKADRPNSTIVFWSFRLMVGLGVLMVLVGVWSLWLRLRGRLYASRGLLAAAVIMGPSGFIAMLAGWITTEVGRQPYTVYGLLRTSQSVSPIEAPAVAASLVAFIVVYFAVFGAGVFYIIQMMRKSPESAEPDLEKGVPTRAAGITPQAALEPSGAAAGSH